MITLAEANILLPAAKCKARQNQILFVCCKLRAAIVAEKFFNRPIEKPMVHVLFWASLALLFYSFVGYGVLLFFLVKLKKLFVRAPEFDASFEPEVTLVVPCYNEAGVLDKKVQNCFALDYPKDKLKLLFITDGSTDNSVEVLKKYPSVTVLHSSRRGGKTAAENRAMQQVDEPVVIFTDANTLLNKEAVRNIIRHLEIRVVPEKIRLAIVQRRRCCG
jgi:poly-beta-1,6-N-acetyl-D-glucosamine synthase